MGHSGSIVPTEWLAGPPDDVIDQDELDAVLLNWGAELAAAHTEPAESAALAEQSRHGVGQTIGKALGVKIKHTSSSQVDTKRDRALASAKHLAFGLHDDLQMTTLGREGLLTHD